MTGFRVFWADMARHAIVPADKALSGQTICFSGGLSMRLTDSVRAGAVYATRELALLHTINELEVRRQAIDDALYAARKRQRRDDRRNERGGGA